MGMARPPCSGPPPPKCPTAVLPLLIQEAGKGSGIPSLAQRLHACGGEGQQSEVVALLAPACQGDRQGVATASLSYDIKEARCPRLPTGGLPAGSAGTRPHRPGRPGPRSRHPPAGWAHALVVRVTAPGACCSRQAARPAARTPPARRVEPRSGRSQARWGLPLAPLLQRMLDAWCARPAVHVWPPPAASAPAPQC